MNMEADQPGPGNAGRGTSPELQHPASVPQNNGLAIASLVLGLLWLGGVGAILAVVFGHTALRQISQANGTQSGRGMATAGTVLGWLGVAATVALVAASIGVLNQDTNSSDCDRVLQQAAGLQSQPFNRGIDEANRRLAEIDRLLARADDLC